MRHGAGSRTAAGCAAFALLVVAAACADGGRGDAATTQAGGVVTTSAPAPAETTAPPEDPAPTPADPAGGADTTVATGTEDPHVAFPSLGPPTGEPMVLGLSNTEGVPGLDFPEIRRAIEGAADYLNAHGGVGGRPVVLETCNANGSPEGSQACAQELTGKGVEMVLLGLDLFPDYATYTAAGVPVVGVLPILPGDYSADALFLTGGNVTIMTAMAVTAKEHFGAASVGIISADNPGSNSSEASLTQALDRLGVAHTTVKGGDVETDAGFQGLMREASGDSPDVLVSLYSDAGCIGTMRARASLGVEIPVLTTGICSSTEVLEQVGDDALGWNFVGVATPEESPSQAILQEIMAPVVGVDPGDVDQASLGLGVLGLFLMMSLAVYGNELAADGADVTGEALYEHVATGDDLTLWPGSAPVECGAAPDFPSICSFTFPIAEYVEGGGVRTIEGLDALSVLEHLS